MTAQLPTRNAANIPDSDKPSYQVEFQSHDGEIYRDEEGERHLADVAASASANSLALFMHDGEPGQEGGEDQADVERPGDYAISQQNCDGIARRRVFSENVKARLIDSLYDAWQHGQTKRKESYCGSQVIRHLPRIQMDLSGQSCGHRQRQPQDNVFQHGYAENQSRKTGVKDFQVGKDFGNDGNRSDRDSYGKNDDGEMRLPLGPASDGRISLEPKINTSANGMPLPTTASQPTSRRSS